MSNNFTPALKRWALLEGTSLLVLLLIAVPLKHLGQMPLAVKFVGPLHGLFFLSYQYQLLSAYGAGVITSRQTLKLTLAALVPGGTLYAFGGRKS